MHDIDIHQDEPMLDREKEGQQSISFGNKWTQLPSDILEMIMKRLRMTDYLRIRAVCSSWRATITRAIANKHCHPLPELPLVFLTLYNKHILSHAFFSINTKQVCFRKSNNTLPDRRHQCHGMVPGWMILSTNLSLDAKIIFFLNPVTGDVVLIPSPLNLPSESPIPDKSDLHLGKMVASSSPRCEDCVVVGRFTDYVHIAYFRVNSDKSWTIIRAEKDSGDIVDLEIFDDKLYVMTNKLNDHVLVLDIQDSNDNPPKLKVFGKVPPPTRPLQSLRIHDQIHVKGNVFYYLARGYASGELLLIYLFHNFVFEPRNVGYMNIIKRYVSPPRVTKVEVFKLDTSNDKWVKLDNLGDRVLFIGHFKSLVMSRAALNSSQEVVAENSIYFASHYHCPEKPWLSTRLGKLCVTDNSVEYFSLQQFGDGIIEAIPYWFLPSPW